jgi:nicotinate dehydrogenase subunit B
MGPVVTQLADVPDADIRAMAVYLASLAPAPPPGESAAQLDARTMPGAAASLGARIYDGACAACHQAGRGPVLFGARPSLALNSNVHSATPDNLIRVVLEGIAVPSNPDLGAMPAFGGTLDDHQVAELVRYIRGQFAPDLPDWTDLERAVARVRGLR